MSHEEPIVKTYCSFCEDNVEFLISPHIREQAVNLRVNLPCPDCYRLCSVTLPPPPRPVLPEANGVLGSNPLAWLMPFVNMDTVMPGAHESTNNTLLSMARAQAGLDVEQWITDMLSQQEKKPTSKAYLTQLFDQCTLTIRAKHLRQLCLAVDGLPTLVYPHPAGFGKDPFSVSVSGVDGACLSAGANTMSPLTSPSHKGLYADDDVCVVVASELHTPTSATLNVHSLPRGPHTWLTKRGDVSFARKAIVVQQSGGVCVVVGQTGSEWPYVMTDSTNATVTIPAVMVAEADYNAITAFLTRLPHNNIHPRMCLFHRPRVLSCAVCVEDLSLGDQVINLPCQHKFHHACIEPWLSQQHTCPVCRHELPQEAAEEPRKKAEEIVLWS